MTKEQNNEARRILGTNPKLISHKENKLKCSICKKKFKKMELIGRRIDKPNLFYHMNDWECKHEK